MKIEFIKEKYLLQLNQVELDVIERSLAIAKNQLHPAYQFYTEHLLPKLHRLPNKKK